MINKQCMKFFFYICTKYLIINNRNMKERIISSSIIAVGIVILGLCLKGGIDNFVNKDRQVTVKGLAEKEVEADKVTWNISAAEAGDDLPAVYQKVQQIEEKIKVFLTSNGIKTEDIHSSAPSVVDHKAERYSDGNEPSRYLVELHMSVSSKEVKKVRDIINRQGELLKEGISLGQNNDYDNPIKYEYEGFNNIKPEMMKEAIANAQNTAEQFAENSQSSLNKIVTADQGQFSIDTPDPVTPYKMKVRVVTTITYSLKD